MTPMLAKTYSQDKYKHKRVILQPKLDGVRVIWDPASQGFYSRDGKRWNSAVVSHLLDVFSKIDCPIDGEFYYHGYSLQRINAAIAVNRTAPSKETTYIGFHAFDIPDTTKSALERITRLAKVLTPWAGYCTRVAFVPSKLVDYSHEVVQDMHDKYVRLGYEGAMLRDPDRAYVYGRTDALLKMKAFQDDVFKVVGMCEGEGRNSGRLGALICQTTTGQIFQVGTGFDDAQRSEYWSKNLQHLPGTHVKVKFQIYTDDGIPRHPVFVCFE